MNWWAAGAMKLALLFLIILLGSKCSLKHAVGLCPDGLSIAVLHNLQSTLRGYNEINALLDRPSLEDLDKEQAEINRIGAWVRSTPELDQCARAEYNSWLTAYYQGGLNRAYRGVRDGTGAKHMEHYRKKTDREYSAADALEIPAPPDKQGK